MFEVSSVERNLVRDAIVAAFLGTARSNVPGLGFKAALALCSRLFSDTCRPLRRYAVSLNN